MKIVIVVKNKNLIFVKLFLVTNYLSKKEDCRILEGEIKFFEF